MTEVSDMKKVIDLQKQERIDMREKLKTAVDKVNQIRKEKRDESSRLN